jgi:Nucleotidyltransferase of unknown function (DUF6036)
VTLPLFGYDEIVAAFEALDRVSTQSRRIVVLGGAAVAIHTRTSTGTKDIDHDPPSIDELIAKCATQGIELPPFSAVTIAQYPYHYEDRLVRVLPDLRLLEVLVLEPHDLVLSKIDRWFEGDEADVRELHGACTLTKRTLIERYVLEMNHVMGDLRRIDENFVECIAALFGEISADEARHALPTRR